MATKQAINTKKLLVVEDDPGLQSQLKWCFDGYDVEIAGDREAAITALRRHEPAVVTLDLGLPPDPANVSEGFRTLEEILTLAPGTKVIVVTGNDDRVNAITAVSKGAYDFYEKPIEPDILKIIIDRAYRLYELENENQRLSAQQMASPLQGVVANSNEMLKVCKTIEKIAPADVTVLLHGESGTGKEVLAKAIHQLSPRNEQKFVAINCAAIPENLLESELFGYEKGAFTGATKRTFGKIETAHQGTLMLDEIGDLPMALQAKLLRFLQERVIERLGGRDEIPVDVRVICATHRNLQDMIADGSFREDLYYRLAEITVEIPAVRDRYGDAILLAKAFFAKHTEANGSKLKGFSKEALSAIESYAWPGNVRELDNKIKRAVIMAEGEFITTDELQIEGSDSDKLPLNLRKVRDEAELQALRRALSVSDDNVSQAAELLGLSRPTLYDLMNKYDLKK